MLFIEQPPGVLDSGDDPLFSALHLHYGLSPRSLRPLWWHAVENLEAGHSALGAVVITNRESVTEEDATACLSHVSTVIQAVADWQSDLVS
jgi:hypothetical protein